LTGAVASRTILPAISGLSGEVTDQSAEGEPASCWGVRRETARAEKIAVEALAAAQWREIALAVRAKGIRPSSKAFIIPILTNGSILETLAAVK